VTALGLPDRAVIRPSGRSGLVRQQRFWGVVLAAPALVGFTVFTAIPMIASAYFSLTDWQIANQAQWVGAENYQRMITDQQFHKALKATGLFVLWTVPASLISALVAALLLNSVRTAQGFFRTVFYLPVLVPPVAGSVLWLWMFNPDLGILNTALQALHLPTSQWIYSESSVMPSLALMAAWGFGSAAVIFLAGLKGISRELYEAAECDGAGALRRFWHITLPQLSPVVLFNAVMAVIAGFQAFDQAYIMTGGGPNGATNFIVFYLYNEAFQSGDFGYASALAWVLLVIIVVATLTVFRSARRWVFYDGGPR
jgi:multiple sugar transport system permease protein